MNSALGAGVCLFMLSGSAAFAQDAPDGDNVVVAPRKVAVVKKDNYVKKEISGCIYDAATHQPLVGAQLIALGNPNYAAMTDEKGQYTISVPTFVTALYVTCPEYNGLQLPLHGETTVDGSLFQDVVSNAYRNSSDLAIRHIMDVRTSSAITIENDIENKLNSSVRTISRGGMIGQGASLFIDGLTSLNSTAQPLVIVDGVMWDMQYDRTTIHDGFFNSLYNIIDPEDINTVEVLKNGTALYGAKGANGVIIINTKRGTSMATRINVRVYGGFEQSPEQMKMMNASQYRNYLTDMSGSLVNNSTDYSASYIANLPFMIEDPNYIYYQKFHNETNWQKDLYQNAFTQNYRVNVEGGDDVAKYNLSLGFTQGDATAKKNDFNRINIRFNTDIQMFSRLFTQLDISYVRTAYNLRDNGWAQDYSSRNISSPNVLGLLQTPFIGKNSYYIIYEDGMNKLVPSTEMTGKNYTDSNNPFTFVSSLSGNFNPLANPYWILKNGQGDNKNYQEQTLFSLNIAPRLEINKHLNLKNRFSYSIDRTNEKYYMPLNGTPTISVDGLGDLTNVVASQFAKETTLFNDFSINWGNNYGGNDIKLVGGFRFNSYTYNYNYVRGYNNASDKMPNASTDLQYKSNGGSNDNWKSLSYYATADYNFQDRYLLQGGVTLESSSRFGHQAADGLKMFGVKWGVFPSLQAAWVMSNESWFKTNNIINYLKLNVGYNESGNDNINYYASKTYFSNVRFLSNATGLSLTNIENPRIQWETNRRLSATLQANFLENRLFASFEVYHSKTSNLLTKKSVSDITGISTMWSNDGALKNTGLDFSLNALVLNLKNFKWQIGASVGKYKNEITELPSTSTIKLYRLDANGQKETDPYETINGYTSSIYGTNNILTSVGNAAGVFYGYKTAGVFSTDAEASTAGKYGYLKYPTGLTSQPSRNFMAGDVHFVDVNGDGWISEADMVKIGDPNPDFFGNFSTSLSFKGLTLDVIFKYSVGNDIFNYQRSMVESENNAWNQTTAIVNRWRYSGQITSVPRAVTTFSDSWVNNERFSDRWIEDGSYLKLKKIRLTYKIPVQAEWLQGLSVWGEANNVFTATKYSGLDPEVSAGNSVLYQGIDAGYLPQSRSFNLGVTINL